MLRLLCSLILLLALATCGTADAPLLTLPAQVSGPVGSFVAVSAQTTGKNVRWLALDPGLNLFPVSLLKTSSTAVVMAAAPGSYRLLAMTAAGDELSLPAICQVVIQSANPAPVPPGPAPPPTPTPSTVGNAAWAIVVIDNNARTAAIGQMLSDQTLRTTLQARGVHLRILDVNDPLVTTHNYQASVQVAGGPPVLLAFDKAGQKIKVCRLPADVATFLAEFPATSTTVQPLSCGPWGCPRLLLVPENSR